MKRFIVFACLILASSRSASANDTAFAGVGGSLQLLKGEHRDVQMVREWVWMEIWPTHYVTTVEYDFTNFGRAQNVTMGFPESGGGDISGEFYRSRSGFDWFATWVDGRRVGAKRQLFKGDEYSGYEAMWMKTVPFRSGQTRRLKVRYRSRVGGEASYFKEGGGRFANYNFTGGNWRNDVRSSTLTAIFHGDNIRIKNIYARSDSEKVAPPNSRRRGNWIRYYWRNWPAQGSWWASFTAPKISDKN